jgi:hypothetical protein
MTFNIIRRKVSGIYVHTFFVRLEAVTDISEDGCPVGG